MRGNPIGNETMIIGLIASTLCSIKAMPTRADGYCLLLTTTSSNFLTSASHQSFPETFGRWGFEVAHYCGLWASARRGNHPRRGDVFDGWRGAFGGLHLLLGYGAITYDNTEEGSRIIRCAQGGQTLVASWFRTAQEIQPSNNGANPPDGPTVWVGAMWGSTFISDPGNECLPRHGFVTGDPILPSTFTAMWTVC